ncbi:AraC family transcriptional regulator [Olivibacter sp. CPCC 100613]|uniref:AraC family transcriptional regulator n=1 Tax=Olivibacter sp. CPCC 100613 TaxID=3079931 RepID=UPI002FFA81C0
MKRYVQYQPFVIEEFETSIWKHAVHKHNHYELIYIKEGEGLHYIQNNGNDYHEGSLFLLGPEDDHYFDIHRTTRFIYVKFTDLQLYKGGQTNNVYLQKLEYLIKSKETHLSSFLLRREDLLLIEKIFNSLSLIQHQVMAYEEFIRLQLFSIALILQHNMPELLITKDKNRDMQALFCYIHKHIYSPPALQAAEIAKHFNKTADYIGPYFKRQTGMTLRNYIRHYRNQLIKKRLSSNNYRLKEIAAEFGLVDESHVLKLLRSGVEINLTDIMLE